MWEKINHPISCSSRRGLSLIAFRQPVSIGCSNRFVLLTVGGQNTIGFLTPETSVREKKIPEWKWGRSAKRKFLRIDIPPTCYLPRRAPLFVSVFLGDQRRSANRMSTTSYGRLTPMGP
jgi:hypothetical protein